MMYKNPKISETRYRGFTLIEVLMVVALIGIIAAIALPSYNNSVMRSKRSTAQGELMAVQSRQEQYFINNKAYTTDLTDLGYNNDPFYIDEQGNQVSAGNSTYEIDLSSGSSTSEFTIVATPQNSQADDSDCPTLKLSSNGDRSPDDCW